VNTLVGRNNELKQLTESYESQGNKAIVLYGRYGMGKTTLALEFIKNLPAVYYSARELSEQEQLLTLTGEAGVACDAHDAAFSYYRCFKQAVERNPESKTVFVIDEFQYMISSGEGFKNAFVTLMKEPETEGKIMFLLLSSSVNWVENSLVEDMGPAARNLAGFIKLKEFTFVELLDRFPKMQMADTIYAGGILGGGPGLLDYWSEKLDVKDNIMRLFLMKRGLLRNEAERFLKSELRELPAYNAILATLAAGNWKLNDIYARTGFSRAKISVYLKNLICLDIVEKVFSMETGSHDDVKKGMYCIKDNYLCFWYRYVFPNMSLLDRGMEKEVYENIVSYDLDNFMRERYASVCFEYMKLMSDLGKLSRKYEKWGRWYGKAGDIDVVGRDEEGHTLVAFCNFKSTPMNGAELRKYRELMRIAGVVADEIYIFAKSGFGQDIKVAAAYDKINLINMDEL
jgi:AAA+ ATPase superfamily predicted ATPase